MQKFLKTGNSNRRFFKVYTVSGEHRAGPRRALGHKAAGYAFNARKWKLQGTGYSPAASDILT